MNLKKTKVVSVIIAAYAAEQFIRDAVKSVLAQKLPANYQLELIVGVDGCNKTWGVLDSFQNENLKIFKMECNQGTYITFNTMMNYARGSLIARFDADDIMLENYLANQIKLLEIYKDVHITRTWSIYTDIEKRPIKTLLGDGTWTSEKGERRKGSDGQMMFRKEVWNHLGAFKPWRCSADTEFLIRAEFSGFNLKEVEDFLYLRRVHENSLTQCNNTGVESPVRNTYKNIILKNLEDGMSKEECRIKPVIGTVEPIFHRYLNTSQSSINKSHALITIISYKTSWLFLAYHLTTHKVIEVQPGDKLSEILDSGKVTNEVLFQINLSCYASFFSDTTDPHDLIEKSGRRVLNKGLYDISKSKVHEVLKTLNFPSLNVSRNETQNNCKVIIKSNLNYGGLFERDLPQQNLEKLGINYDLTIVPTHDKYKVLPVNEVPENYWNHKGVVIERFIENEEGSYIRIYKFRNKFIFSQAFMPHVEIKKMNHMKHKTYFLVDSENIDYIENPTYKNALNIAANFCINQNIDLCTIDMLTDNNKINYIIDLNHTPFWGEVNNHHFIDYLTNC